MTRTQGDSAPVRVGLSANILHADPQRTFYRGKTLHYGDAEFCEAIARAGATPLILPALPRPEDARALIGSLDALVLTGGADVSPTSYGEAPIDAERWPGDPIRDAYELALVRAALEPPSGPPLPVLAVCRGIQLLNVALGGTLYQDLATQLPGAGVHRDDAVYCRHPHPVRVAPGWIRDVYGGARDTLIVNSVHHQGVKDLAPGLTATAWAEDGLIEAVERVDQRGFVVGVQWHPEWMRGGPTADGRAAVESGDRMFAAFVAEVRQRRARPPSG